MDLMTEWIDPALPQAAAASGMVRIARGGQQRWIWPVHLPGWIALGWQVSHPTTSAAAGIGELEALTAQQGASDSTEQASEETSMADAIAQANGRRRGRKPKAQETDAPELMREQMAAVTSAAPEAAQPSVDAAAESVPGIAPSDTENDAPEAQPDFGSVMPDDLLSEAF